MKNTRRTAMICFYNDQKEILLQERGTYSKLGEEWAFFGGGIEAGETPEEGFFREAHEELGLDMSLFPYEYLGEQFIAYPDRDVYRYFYLILTKWKAEDFEIYEGIGAKFFSLKEARTLKFPSPVDPIIDKLEGEIEKRV